MGVFENQPKEYRDAVLPPEVKKRVAIEAGATHGWHKYAGTNGEIIGVDRFGASAPGEKWCLRNLGLQQKI